MELSTFFLFIAVLTTATPTPIAQNAVARFGPTAAEPPSGAVPPFATILFDIDGNEARANFKVPIPEEIPANQRLLALSIQAVNGLVPGRKGTDVICQAFDAAGEALGKPFDILTRVVLSGSENKQVDVGLIECRWK